MALVAASSAGALVIGTRSADRSAARHARLALAGAEVALDRGDPASARRLLDDAAHSNPEVAGLAAVRARLAAAERRLDEARAAYATADRQFSARHYAEAMRGFAALGDFADAPRRASQARDAARRLALAQALRALADDPAGALRWVDRSREFGDSADARQVARAARGVLGHQQAERDALARLHQVEAQLQSQSQGGGAGSSRNTSNGSSGQGGSGTGNGGWAPAGTSGGSGSGGGSRGPSGGGSNSGARPSRHG